MNILLWVLQAVLAFLNLSGGAYKLFKFDEMAKQLDAIPRGAWSAVGVFEMVAGILLVLPTTLTRMPGLTALAAAALTVEAIGLSLLYARSSIALAATNPLMWSAVMALLSAFVAYGRYAPKPSS